MYGLAALVETVLLENVYCGHVFVFRGRKGDLINVLWADRDGICLFVKRLERGRFVWPQASSGTVHLTPAQLSRLLKGIDWRRPQRTSTTCNVPSSLHQSLGRASISAGPYSACAQLPFPATPFPNPHQFSASCPHDQVCRRHGSCRWRIGNRWRRPETGVDRQARPMMWPSTIVRLQSDENL